MAAEAPNSYRDPYWSNLAGTVEAKLELPKGLLAAIVSRGERSNADQVSEAGAKSVFQIIPATRKAAIDKWGIDPYLSPENAAEVAGLLLKDSLRRNKGDAALAVAEYVGGTDRTNWGRTTKSYVQRVIGAVPSAVADAGPIVTRDLPPAGPAGNLPDGSQSTFDRLSTQAAKPTEASIASVLQAYQGGQMTPQEAKQFEADVNAGRVMLPRGASLTPAPAPAAPTARAGAPELPPAVIAAYQSGQMTGEERAQLEADVNSGAVRLPQGTPPTSPSAPGAEVANLVTGGQLGNAETAATIGTGLLGQIGGGLAGLGTAAGNALGLTDRDPADVVRSVADAMTYVPRTEAAKSNLAVIGAPFEALAHGADVAGSKVAEVTGSPALGAAANTGIQMLVPGVVGKGAARALPAVAQAAEALRRGPDPLAMVERAPGVAAVPATGAVATPTPGTLPSVGAAGTDLATQRRAAASGLPVPIELTKGQAERSFEQQRFEQETAKDPNVGARLRERQAETNARMNQNFDAFVDATGAEAQDLIGAGKAIDKPLREQAARDKTEIRVAYREAEKAGQMEDPVSMAPILKYVDDNASLDSPTLAPVLATARKEISRLGEDGAELPLRDVEVLRRQINRAIGADPANATNMRAGVELKQIIDAQTEGLGGDIYKQARALRSRYAQRYENRSLIADLLANKGGMADRKVAYEDVFNRIVMKGTRDDLSYLRATLHRAGPEGRQGWREIQGATMRFLRDKATEGVGTDVRGNPIVSADKLNRTVRLLEADGKLDFIFGKAGAQQVRDLNDLAKVVYTSPPGSVNTSNTASVLLAALTEAGVTGSLTGLPVPVMSGLRLLAMKVKDRRIQRRIEEALGRAEKPQQPTRPAAETLH